MSREGAKPQGSLRRLIQRIVRSGTITTKQKEQLAKTTKSGSWSAGDLRALRELTEHVAEGTVRFR